MTLAYISVGSEVRFIALWKTRFYQVRIFLSEPETIKTRNQFYNIKDSDVSLTQRNTILNRDVGLCLAHGSRQWA